MSSSVEEHLANAIAARTGTRDILLCGSRAVGNACDESDYDVLVALPRRRIAFVLPRLAQLSRTLSSELGVSVTVNPLPSKGLRARRPNLFTWKLLQEARPLAGSTELRTVPPIVLSPRARFSYLASALWYLIEDAVGDTRPGRGEEKARLHLAQLQLLDRGEYASTLGQALAASVDPRLRVRSWEGTRALVLAELQPLLRDGVLGGALRVNSRYAVLAALRGSIRFTTALRRLPVDVVLVRALVLLAEAVDAPANDSSNRTASTLPRPLRPSTRAWPDLVAAIRKEWPSAHPLLAQ